MAKKSKYAMEELKDLKNILETIQLDIKDIKDKLIKSQNEVAENKNITLDLIEKQNKNICQVLSDHNVSLTSIINSYWKTPKFVKNFPVKTDESLLQWDNDINEENMTEMVKTVTTIMAEKGVIKGLPYVIAPKVLLNYNLNGTHNKKRLNNFEKVMEVLFLSYTSSSVNETGRESFEKIMRLAIKNLKNRHFKDVCLKQKKEKENANK